MERPLKVAYILLHFPYLTETFVAEEIHTMRSLGVDVRIISLLEPGSGPVQPLSEQLLPYSWYTPGLFSYKLWKAQLYFISRTPFLLLQMLVDLLRQPCPRNPWPLIVKRLVIFFKAIAVAYHLRDSNIQLVHTHFAWLSGTAAWICARLLDLPFTVTVHAFDVFSHKNDLLRLVCKQANHVIAISEHNQHQVEALGVRPTKTISVIHCGVNLEEIDSSLQKKEGSYADVPFSIISVGSLYPKKGHTYLIDACNLLQKRGLNFVCSIIGIGPEEPALRQQILSYGLQSQVKLLGSWTHPKIMAIYGQHEVFVLGSIIASNGDRDGIPVVLMEAGACSLPLISTNVSGIPELVRHGDTGLIVPPGDSAALSDAIYTLAFDTGLRKQLGQNARALVEAEFNCKINTLRLKSLFHKTISSEKNKRDTTQSYV